MKAVNQSAEIRLQLSTIYMEIVYLRKQIALCIEQLVMIRMYNKYVDPNLSQYHHELIDGYRIEIKILQEHAQSLMKMKNDPS